MDLKIRNLLKGLQRLAPHHNEEQKIINHLSN